MIDEILMKLSKISCKSLINLNIWVENWSKVCMLSLGDRFVGLAKTKTFKMSTVETVNSGLTHFPMGRGNYLRRAGLPFVRLILAAVLLGGAVSQGVAQYRSLNLSTGEMDTFSFTLTAPSSIKTFTITATGLTDGVTVSAPSQFEVSKNTAPANFANSISFSTSEFSLARQLFLFE